MLFNGKNNLFIFLVLSFSLSLYNLFSQELTEYLFFFEVEDNTSDKISSINYTKNFVLLDRYSSISYFDRFILNNQSLSYKTEVDFLENLTYLTIFYDNRDNSNDDTIRKGKKSNNFYNNQKKERVNGFVKSIFYYNHFFFSDIELELSSKNLFETLNLSTDKKNLTLSNDLNFLDNKNFGLNNFTLFRYGESKDVFNNLSFNQTTSKYSFMKLLL